MGADLYIPSLYEPNRTRWEAQLEAASRLRDSLPKGSAEQATAEQRVSECYEQMNNQGYFRDPYNDWDVLWQFGLSWWADVIPMLDKHDRLSVASAKRLLDMLTERESAFEERVKALPAKDEQYFHSRYIELRQFLNRAIVLNEPVDCSL